jgi:hypothetical protein
MPPEFPVNFQLRKTDFAITAPELKNSVIMARELEMTRCSVDSQRILKEFEVGRRT